MAITPINTSNALPAVSRLDVPTGTRPTSGGSEVDASFSNLIRGMLDQANTPHAEAEAAVAGLATGDTDNIHSVVMSMVNADMSFRFVLELRNRLTEAYQEIMRMQV